MKLFNLALLVAVITAEEAQTPADDGQTSAVEAQTPSDDIIPCPSEGCPCPSNACWVYDKANNKCNVKDECTTLQCDPTQIVITFTEDVFGAENGVVGVIPEPTLKESGEYSLTCGLGDCDMTYRVVGTTLLFSVELGQNGNVRTRSGSVQNTRLELGDMTIVTTPFGIGITFECGYPMGITLESDPYTVTDVDISGTQSGTGSLDGGFELTVGGGEEHKVMLGGVLEVTATWSITTLTDVSFYFDRCGVVHGSQNVNVIQDSCFSVALKTGATSSSNTEVSFKFKTFGIDGEDDVKQTIVCDIKLCTADVCDKATLDNQCPTGASEDFFQYHLTGFSYV